MTDRGPRRLLRPSELEPVHLDLRRIFWAVIGAWTLALVVSGALTLAGRLEGRIPWICVTGIALGFLALLWERRNGPDHQAPRPEAVESEGAERDA